MCNNSPSIWDILTSIGTIAMAATAAYTIVHQCSNENYGRKQQLLQTLRESALKLSEYIDDFRLNQLKQELAEGNASKVVDEFISLSRNFNIAFDNLNFLLQDRDNIYGIKEKDRWMAEIGKALHNYRELLLVLNAFALFDSGRDYVDSKKISFAEHIQIQLEEKNLQCRKLNEYIKKKPDCKTIEELRAHVLKSASLEFGVVSNEGLDSVIEKLYRIDSFKLYGHK